MRPMPNTRELRRVPRSHDRILTGVAGGWADRWGVEPTVVRAAVALLALAGGIGVVVYGLAALASGPPTGEPRAAAADQRRHLAIATATAAILVAVREVGLWPGDAIMLPAAAAAIGTAAAWMGGLGRRGAGPGWTIRIVQVTVGVVLVAAGVVSLARRTGGLSNVGASAAAIAVVVGGLAMFAAPAVGRVLRSLDDERALRIREDERAAVAAHLHDSVLQSLVLIQRSDDSRRMATLARRQERELRTWLYGTHAGTRSGEPVTLHAAIEALTLEIESDHDIRVEAVIVGDQPYDTAARTLVAAVREALVNAARHAGVDRVDVFVEADDTELTGFVRDTGRGFDRNRVPTDRRGISDSIVGRARRAGGSATLTSTPGTGTEVEIRVPRGGV